MLNRETATKYRSVINASDSAEIGYDAAARIAKHAHCSMQVYYRRLSN
jgi:fumarate hydratase class II